MEIAIRELKLETDIHIMTAPRVDGAEMARIK